MMRDTSIKQSIQQNKRAGNVQTVEDEETGPGHVDSLNGSKYLSGFQRVAVIVAHPDDEVLWCGGLLLSHPEWSTFVAVLCRGSDLDRAPRLFRALHGLGARGAIGDLDDGPGQDPLDPAAVVEAILALLPGRSYDLILTHAPCGEYTRHRRHEEVSRAVCGLWRQGLLHTSELWLFAYEDGGRAYLPRAEADADQHLPLPGPVWQAKRRLITDTYNYGEATWEAGTTPREEAFRRFSDPGAAAEFCERSGPA